MPRRRVYGRINPADDPEFAGPALSEGWTWQQVQPPPNTSFGLIPVWEATPPANSQMPSTFSTSAGPSVAGPSVPSLPDYSQIDDLIAQINATNQAAQHAANLGRIPGAAELEAQSSQNIAGLLNPPTQFAEIDVPSAAQAVASGTVGSPFAGVTGLNLTENERLRRQGLGQQYLSAAYARNPAAPIADPQALFQFLQQQGFQSGESARARAFQAEQAALDRALQAQLGFLNQRRPGTSSGGRGGPYLPTDYGRAPGAPATYRTNIPGASATGSGVGETFGIPASAIPDNWNDLSFEQQAQYAALINANPYYGLPDYVNPYSNEYEGHPTQFWQDFIDQNPLAPPAEPAPNLGFDYEFDDYYA